MEDFAQLVNELSKKNRTIQDLCNSIHLLGKAAGINSMLPIYEYVGRIIEFCIATDVMKYNLWSLGILIDHASETLALNFDK